MFDIRRIKQTPLKGFEHEFKKTLIPKVNSTVGIEWKLP